MKTIAAIKANADVTRKFNELPDGTLKVIASKMIKVFGYYTYIRTETKEKVFIEA